MAIKEFTESPIAESIFSVALICILVVYREETTPEFLHFVTCVVDEEVHFCFVMLVWLFWRCFLEPEPTSLDQMSHEKVVVERIKIVVKAALEL